MSKATKPKPAPKPKAKAKPKGMPKRPHRTTVDPGKHARRRCAALSLRRLPDAGKVRQVGGKAFRCLTTQEMADALGYSSVQCYLWRKRGTFPNPRTTAQRGGSVVLVYTVPQAAAILTLFAEAQATTCSYNGAQPMRSRLFAAMDAK